MNKRYLIKKSLQLEALLGKFINDLNDPSIFKFIFFIDYIFGNTAATVSANAVSPFCFFAFRISPKILKLK